MATFSISSLLKKSRFGVSDVAAGIVQQGLVAVFGFLATVFMARGLGPSNLGLVSLALSISGIATSLSDLGIGQTAIRFGSRELTLGQKDKAFKVFRWAFRVRILQSLGVSLLFLIIAPYFGVLWGNANMVGLVRWSLILGILGAMSHIPNVYFQAIRRFWLNAGVAVFQAAVSLAGILLLRTNHWWTPLAVLQNSIGATLLGTVAVLCLVPRQTLIELSPRVMRKLAEVKMWFKAPSVSANESVDERPEQFSRYLMVSSVIVMVYTRLDVWILGTIKDPSAVGAYAIANKIVLPLSMVLGALSAALWPRVSSAKNQQELRNLFRRTLAMSALLAIPAAIYSLVGPVLIPILFGVKYEAGVLPAQLLGLRYVIDIIVCPVGIVGYGFGMVKIYPLINFAQMLVMVILSVSLLKSYGAVAVALGILLADLLGMILSALILYKRMKARSLMEDTQF